MKRSGFKGLVAAGIVAAGIASSTSIVSASDMFLKIGDIKGESVDDKHKDWIEVLSWSWGTSTGTGKTKRGNVPAVCVQDLVLTKKVDSASPELIMNGVLGQSVKEATLTMRKAGKGQQEFLVIKMQDVLVSSYQTGGSAGSEADLMDQLVLHFRAIQGEYRPQKPDGSLGNPVVFSISGDCNDRDR